MIGFAVALLVLGVVLLILGIAVHAAHLLLWLGIVLAMVCARSTAMAFNRLADRRLDARNPRTALRHLPSGLLSPTAVAVTRRFAFSEQAIQFRLDIGPQVGPGGAVAR